MKAASIVVAVALSSAAVGQEYTLLPGSDLMQELCLPPCLCPYMLNRGPVSGRFELEQLDSTPIETRYAVRAIDWTAMLDAIPVTIHGGGIYTIRTVGPAMMHRMQLDLTIGPAAITTHLDSGLAPVRPERPFPEIAIAVSTVDPVCRRDSFRLLAGPASCYANCDGSTSAPILNVADFTCFLQQYAAGSAYANCDQSTQPPVLNVADFACFMKRFAVGCK
jgi:hypothetical protein